MRKIVWSLVLLIVLLPLLIFPFAADSVSLKTYVAQETVLLLLLAWAWRYRCELRIGRCAPLRVACCELKSRSFNPQHVTRNPHPISALSWSLLVFLLLGVLSFLMSDYRYASFEEWMRYGTSIGLVFLVRYHVHTKRQVKQLLAALSISTALACVYGLAQRLGYDFVPWDIHTGRILSSFGHPNFFADYLVIVLPILLMSFVVVDSTRARVFLGATLVMAVLCLLFSYSRGAFLGILPAVGVLTGMLFVYLTRGERRRYRRPLVVLALLVLIPLVLTLALDKRLMERTASATKLETKLTAAKDDAEKDLLRKQLAAQRERETRLRSSRSRQKAAERRRAKNLRIGDTSDPIHGL